MTYLGADGRTYSLEGRTYWQRVLYIPPPGHIASTVGQFVGGLLFASLLIWLLSGLSVWQFLILCLLMRA